MTPTKLLIGQIVVVFAIVLAGVWFATQWAAAELAFQPELGRPWFLAFGRPVYMPWALFGWWFSFEAYAPTVKARVLPPPVLADGDYADRPASRVDNWAGIVRGTDARLGAATDSDGEDAGGGLEQARHPGQELDHPLTADPITADPLGLADDDGDLAADSRAMDQAQASPVRGFAHNAGRRA